MESNPRPHQALIARTYGPPKSPHSTYLIECRLQFEAVAEEVGSGEDVESEARSGSGYDEAA